MFPVDETVGIGGSAEAAATMNAARWLLAVVTLLTVFGLTMLYSASYGTAGLKFFRTQIIWVVFGVVGGAAAFMIGYRRIASGALIWMGLSFLLLLIAAFCFPAINGANRWIRLRLPGLELSLQPSEFAKIAVAVFVARYCSENFRCFNEWNNRRGILPLAAISGAVILGVLIGRDFGTTVLITLMAVATAMAAGLWWRYILPPAGLFAAMVGYIVWFDPVRLARITSFLRPEDVQREEGYQLWNSLLALGSGGWFGIGFMESRLKARYLPEAHTDFILAIVGEELGLVAMAGVVLLYLAFTWFGLRIATRATSRLGMLLGFGLTLGISLQAWINLLVVTGTAPTKGMPAPFISYGGSNMMASLIAVGLLVSIAADAAYPCYNERYWELLRGRLSFLPWWKEYRRD